jgi:hypothetical protein
MAATDMNALLQNAALGPFAQGARMPMFDPHGQARLLAGLGGGGGAAQTNGSATPAYAFKIVNGSMPQPVTFPDDALNAPGIPR